VSILYDVIVLGAGPAGLSAGLHCGRFGRNVLLIDRGQIGGHLVNMEVVADYPGYTEGINGAELGMNMYEQAAKSGMKSSFGEITAIETASSECSITASEEIYRARAIIICTGLSAMKLEVPGEDQLLGIGVSYCAICDAPLYKGLNVAVIGCGDMAVEDALHLSGFATSVTLVCAESALEADKTFLGRLSAKSNIQYMLNSKVESLRKSNGKVALKLKNIDTGEISELSTDGAFVSVGQEPNIRFVQGHLPLTDTGHLITDDCLQVKAPNVFAAGDVRAGSIKSTAAEVGDGARAAFMAERYLCGRP